MFKQDNLHLPFFLYFFFLVSIFSFPVLNRSFLCARSNQTNGITRIQKSLVQIFPSSFSRHSLATKCPPPHLFWPTERESTRTEGDKACSVIPQLISSGEGRIECPPSSHPVKPKVHMCAAIPRDSLWAPSSFHSSIMGVAQRRQSSRCVCRDFFSQTIANRKWKNLV